MKTRILVFPCGSEIGLEIHYALSNSTHIELFGASSVLSNHGQYLYMNYIEGLPFVEDDRFISELNLLIDKSQIDFIFPAHDSVVLKLSENLNKLHCKVIGSPVETCSISRSKKKTYALFKNLFPVPKVYEIFDNNFNFPVFLKPDVGQGSKGTCLAKTQEEINTFLKRDNSLIILEYLPGEEYTIDCFTDRYGKLRFVGPRERKRISNGISVDTLPVLDKRFEDMAEIINNTLKFRGAWFFQVKKRNDGQLVLLEIAPRIAGAMGMYRNLGVNLPLLSIFDALNIDVSIYSNDFLIEMDRALISRFKTDLVYENVYIDLDDTIIINNQVNIWVMAFLYQCLNKGIKLHLLTKHKGDLQYFLTKYRIEKLFDTINLLEETSKKVEFITEKLSIFIDDSHSERGRVFQELGIPTFGINSLECLIDWRN